MLSNIIEWSNGGWFKPEGRPMYRSYIKDHVAYFVQASFGEDVNLWNYTIENNGDTIAFALDYFEENPRILHAYYTDVMNGEV